MRKKVAEDEDKRSRVREGGREICGEEGEEKKGQHIDRTKDSQPK